MACVPSKDSDQPGHPPSLIRVFAVRMKKPWVLSYPLSAQQRFWSDWADAQADLSLCWVHIPFCWFCHEAAHLIFCYSSDTAIWGRKVMCMPLKWFGKASLGSVLSGQPKFCALLNNEILNMGLFCDPKPGLTDWTQNCRQNGKHCSPWSDCSFRVFSSGSILFVLTCLSESKDPYSIEN